MSKVYKDKKKGVHVCFKGSHYVAPNNSKIYLGWQVDIAFDAVLPGFVTVTQEQSTGKVLEAWQSIGAYIAPKPAKKAPKAAKPAKKFDGFKSLRGIINSPEAKKLLELKKQITREPPVPGPAAMDLIEAKIEAVAPCQDAKDVMMVCFKNWLGDQRHLPLFQGLNYRDPEVTKNVHALGQELIAEWT